MYLSVKPLIKLKKGLNLLDYSIPGELSQNIKIGQLIEIPFRNSSKFGVVFDIKSSTEQNIKIKNILKISDQNQIISENQINFYKWFSDYNFSSLNFLNNIIPIPLKNNIKEKSDVLFINKTKIELKNINSSILENKQFIFKHNFFEEKLTLIKNAIDKNSKNGKLTLIISPTKTHIEHILSALLNFYKDNDYRIITGLTHLSKSKHNEIWNSIKNKKIKFIIGTKMAIFYPIENVGTIIIDESENENLNQIDINPRFEFLPNVLELAKINNLQIVFTSYSPSTYLYNLAKNKEIKLFDIKSNINTQISLLDMSTKYFENNIHFNCEDDIKKSIKENKKILFLLNKKGYSKNLKCNDCNFIFKCENCNSILSFIDKKLFCYNCNKSIDMPYKCPKCNSVSLKNHGIGTQQFKTIIDKTFGQNSVVIDKDNFENFKSIYSDKNNIIIGTKILIDKIKASQFDLIVLPFSYQFLNNSFDSNERFFQLISKLISLKPKKIIIQTINELPIFYHIYNFEYFKMIEEELINRKLLDYPPFSNILKLTIKNIHKNELDKNTIELYDKIRENIKNLDLQILEPDTNKIRSFFIKYIIIKYKNDSEISSIKKILEDVDIIEKNYFKL